MLKELTLNGEIDKVQIAINDIKKYHRLTGKKGAYVAFSGGKDSTVLLDLVKRSGIEYEAHYRCTGFDPPELVYFIHQNYPDVIIDHPPTSLWKLMGRKGPATRLLRWCCDFKEGGGNGMCVLTGVRHQESTARKGRQEVEQCYRTPSKYYLNPIITWTESDVWEYIKTNKIPHCCLYDQGFSRLGCVMCPLTNNRQRKLEEARWPKYARLYKTACNQAYKYKLSKGHKIPDGWHNGNDMYKWWMSGGKRSSEYSKYDGYDLFGIDDESAYFYS